MKKFIVITFIMIACGPAEEKDPSPIASASSPMDMDETGFPETPECENFYRCVELAQCMLGDIDCFLNCGEETDTDPFECPVMSADTGDTSLDSTSGESSSSGDSTSSSTESSSSESSSTESSSSESSSSDSGTEESSSTGLQESSSDSSESSSSDSDSSSST